MLYAPSEIASSKPNVFFHRLCFWHLPNDFSSKKQQFAFMHSVALPAYINSMRNQFSYRAASSNRRWCYRAFVLWWCVSQYFAIYTMVVRSLQGTCSMILSSWWDGNDMATLPLFHNTHEFTKMTGRLQIDKKKKVQRGCKARSTTHNSNIETNKYWVYSWVGGTSSMGAIRGFVDGVKIAIQTWKSLHWSHTKRNILYAKKYPRPLRTAINTE